MSMPTHGIRPKPRSCMVCRSRKVRCDKQSPCNNCRRADIPCIPPADRRPRWASQHDGGGSSGVRTSTAAATSMGSGSTLGPIPGGAASSSSINHILGRVQNLEGMVKQLSAQLEQKRAVPAVSSDMIFTQPCPSEHQQSAPAPAARSNVSGVREQQFGRLVLKDSVDRSPYVTSGFWSQISDELDELRMDVHVLAGAGSGSSEGEVESGRLDDTDEPAGSPFERHAFLFRHNLGPTAPDLGNLKPLPSQIPFLLGVFHENINSLGRLVHMPTITKMVRASQNAKMPTPAHEALIFSIYYTAVVSMEEEDVTLNFGSSKADLSMRYRLGLEYAMAKADFLNSPDIVCLQALIGFLWLLRRQGSPKFVWMMTGLAVRLAQYLGLQRDGAEFIHLTPFEVEMRRRIWWNLYALDLRAAEDQGTDPAIPTSSYGTEIPSNIDDADIDPETVTVPSERAGLSELSFFRMVIKTGIVMRQMMNVKLTSDSARLHELEALLQRMCQTYEQEYGQYTREKGGIAHWMGATLTRLAVAKMTLLVFLPVLLAPSDTRLSNHVRNRLLVAAIEVAEYNHALNSEPTCRKWRWIFQTYIHWYSIVYLMLEISRRPWSSICERAWIALHSGWLIPSQTLSAKNLRVWIPLRKLMARVHKHHNDEYRRLRADAHAVARLDQEDQEIPEPATSELFPTEASTIIFRNRWCELINTPQTPEGNVYPSSMISDTALADHMPGNFHSAWMSSNRSTAANNFSGTTDLPNYTSLQANAGLPVDSSVELNSLPWPWAGFDASMDPFNGLEIDPNYAEMAMEDNVDWYGWVESARDMESGNRQN